MVGFGLVSSGLGSRAWSLTVASLCAFYALWGMFGLGVWLDSGLLLAAAALFGGAYSPMIRSGSPRQDAYGTNLRSLTGKS